VCFFFWFSSADEVKYFTKAEHKAHLNYFKLTSFMLGSKLFSLEDQEETGVLMCRKPEVFDGVKLEALFSQTTKAKL
jgi:hypothetical protein